MSFLTAEPLILTLKLDDKSFILFHDLRRKHFPPERNVVPAHVTLFHALPGEKKGLLIDALKSISREVSPLELSFPSVRFLGGGVAIDVDCSQLLALREQCAREWEPWLTAQDKAPYHPHITIQNKVDASTARQLFQSMTSTWQPLKGTAEGLTLWAYRNGPWGFLKQLSFDA
jgi:2'-5' RNA ligase